MKFFGARAETDAVSTEAGLVISALGISSTASTTLALDAEPGCFLREPDVRGRLEVFLVLLAGAGVASTWSTEASSLGDEVVVVVVVILALLVVNSSAMTMSVISPPSTGELVCSSTSVKSSSTKVPAAKASRHATAHTVLTPSQKR